MIQFKEEIDLLNYNMKNQSALYKMKNNLLYVRILTNSMLNQTAFYSKEITFHSLKIMFFKHTANKQSAENNSTEQFSNSFVLIPSAVINISSRIMLNYAFQLKIERNFRSRPLHTCS